MAQVDVIRPSFETSYSDIQSYVSGVHYAPNASACFSSDDAHCVMGLPTPPPEGETAEASVPAPKVVITGLPALHAGHSNELLRSRILQSALDAEMNEPDAEKAFFVADLSNVYRQYTRFKRCLPGVEPFYGS